MAYLKEPEFQVYQCTNEDCRFRCPTNLSLKKLDHCPLCGNPLLPVGDVFSNSKNQPFTREEPSGTALVLLDNLRSTLNVGSIFRTADGAGVSKIFLSGTTPTPEHEKIKKTGLGAEWKLPWEYTPNGLDLVSRLKKDGVFIISIETSPSATNIFDASRSVGHTNTLLIMGNEVSGIDPEILSLSDLTLCIPMAGTKSSLNVAVAFGIAIYTLIYGRTGR